MYDSCMDSEILVSGIQKSCTAGSISDLGRRPPPIFTPSGCTDIGIRKFDFGAKISFFQYFEVQSNQFSEILKTNCLV